MAFDRTYPNTILVRSERRGLEETKQEGSSPESLLIAVRTAAPAFPFGTWSSNHMSARSSTA